MSFGITAVIIFEELVKNPVIQVGISFVYIVFFWIVIRSVRRIRKEE